jgi:hypothetical protein
MFVDHKGTNVIRIFFFQENALLGSTVERRIEASPSGML